MVGAAGFELATPCTPCKCATRLRYAPNEFRIMQYQKKNFKFFPKQLLLATSPSIVKIGLSLVIDEVSYAEFLFNSIS